VVIVPVLTVQAIEPATALSPWAHLECVARVHTPARTFMAPVEDADNTLLLRKTTGFAWVVVGLVWVLVAAGIF
jgi:hypothetical protein